MLQVKRESQITFLHSEALDRIPGIVHAFSTRRSERNDFTLGVGAVQNPLVQLNRLRFMASIGAPGWPLLKLKQLHSSIVCAMDDTSAAGDAVEGDASITSLPGVLLGVQTADCVPILLADSEGRAAAAIHAGWRGTVAGVAELTVQALHNRYGIKPENIVAALGPHIGVCCYEIGEEVVEAVADPAVIERRTEWPKPHLNLAEANRRQLVKAGVPGGQIEISSLCTRCRADLFFSYRRDGSRTGHMLSVVGIAP
jgi:polyphenol oxidase